MLLWWIGNLLVLLVVIPLVIVLANRVIRSAREAARYADDIREHAVGVSENLDPLPALVQTRELVDEATDKAVRYVAAVRRLAPR